MTAAMQSVILPLDAAVFSISDALGPDVQNGLSLCRALPLVMTNHLKMLGITGEGSTNVVSELSSDVRFKGIMFESIDDMSGVAHWDQQWKKLSECWKMLETFERRSNYRFDIVIKLRFDWYEYFN